MQEKKQEKQFKLLIRVIVINWFAGLFWSVFAVVLYYFNFIEVSPKSYVLVPWSVNGWVVTWKGTLWTIILSSVLSIFIGFIYYVLFKKINAIWMGIIFGVFLWCLFALATQYFYPNIKPLTAFNIESIITSICIFILYGTFTGYAISFAYHETFSGKNSN